MTLRCCGEFDWSSKAGFLLLLSPFAGSQFSRSCFLLSLLVGRALCRNVTPAGPSASPETNLASLPQSKHSHEVEPHCDFWAISSTETAFPQPTSGIDGLFLHFHSSWRVPSLAESSVEQAVLLYLGPNSIVFWFCWRGGSLCLPITPAWLSAPYSPARFTRTSARRNHARMNCFTVDAVLLRSCGIWGHTRSS